MTLVEDEFMSVVVPTCEEICMGEAPVDIVEMFDGTTASSNCTQVTDEVPANVSLLAYLS